jgi:hypothetical protein
MEAPMDILSSKATVRHMTNKPSAPKPTPNDQRSQVKNSNNPAYPADRANRENLGHGNLPPPPPAAQKK